MTFAVVASAHHGTHRAVDVHQHGGALLGLIFMAVLPQRVFNSFLRMLLQVDVKCEADHEHSFVHRLRQRVDELLHLIESPVEIIVGRPLVAPIDCHRRIAAGAEDLPFGHESGLDQIVEDHIGARTCRRQINMRGKSRWRLEEAGQHRRFGKVHVARGFVEVVLCRRVDAESAPAQIGAIKVKFENLVLGQAHLEPEREEGFFDFALDCALVGQEQVLRQLLTDRGTTLHHAPGARVCEHGAEQSGKVDAEMLVEATIFGGERRLDQVVRELIERDRVIVSDAAGAEFVAVAVEKGHREFGLFEPVVVRGFTESGNCERQHNQQARIPQGQALRQGFDERPPPPARDMEPVHQDGKSLVKLPSPGLCLVQAEVDRAGSAAA